MSSLEQGATPVAEKCQICSVSSKSHYGAFSSELRKIALVWPVGRPFTKPARRQQPSGQHQADALGQARLLLRT